MYSRNYKTDINIPKNYSGFTMNNEPPCSPPPPINQSDDRNNCNTYDNQCDRSSPEECGNGSYNERKHEGQCGCENRQPPPPPCNEDGFFDIAKRFLSGIGLGDNSDFVLIGVIIVLAANSEENKEILLLLLFLLFFKK